MWIKAKPKQFQKIARSSQNFFKHPQKHRMTSHAPMVSEIYMIDAVSLYEDLYHKLTPLMQLYAIRFTSSWPNIGAVAKDLTQAKFGIQIPDDASKLSRFEFFERFSPLFT